jgi:hypothetical protein
MAKKSKAKADPHGSTPASGSDRHVANRTESYGTPLPTTRGKQNLNAFLIAAVPKLSGMGASKPLTNYQKGLDLTKARTEYGVTSYQKHKNGPDTVSQTGYKGNSYFGETKKPTPAKTKNPKKR